MLRRTSKGLLFCDCNCWKLNWTLIFIFCVNNFSFVSLPCFNDFLCPWSKRSQVQALNVWRVRQPFLYKTAFWHGLAFKLFLSKSTVNCRSKSLFFNTDFENILFFVQDISTCAHRLNHPHMLIYTSNIFFPFLYKRWPVSDFFDFGSESVNRPTVGHPLNSIFYSCPVLTCQITNVLWTFILVLSCLPFLFVFYIFLTFALCFWVFFVRGAVGLSFKSHFSLPFVDCGHTGGRSHWFLLNVQHLNRVAFSK